MSRPDTASTPALAAALLYREPEPPHPESFAFLRAHGYDVRRGNGPPGGWTLHLRHASWGPLSLEHRPLESWLHAPALHVAPGLLGIERRAMTSARSALLAWREAPTGADPFEARKRFLRALAELLASRALGCWDLVSQHAWTRESLADELAHDGPLDVDALHVLHVVPLPGPRGEVAARVAWVHSHGLEADGRVDFGVLPASVDAVRCTDLWRALALDVLEGELRPGGGPRTVLGGGHRVELVETAEFLERAPRRVVERWAQVLDDNHVAGHAIACEPVGPEGRVVPARFLARPLPDALDVVQSTPATERMAARARATWRYFLEAADAAAHASPPPLVRSPCARSDRRVTHRWLEVRSAGESALSAVGPDGGVVTLTPGEISDWAVPTPAGEASPRWLGPLRALRRQAVGAVSTGDSASSR